MNPSPPATRPSLISRALAALLPLAALPWFFPTPATAAPVLPAVPEAVWPLHPRPPVIRGFEQPAKRWLPGHRGLDLAGSPGQAVRSATSGTITYAGPLAGRGVIVVARGLIRTTYEPVVPSIKLGAAVTPGSVLGALSAAGSHCAPATCLHWGLLQSDTYLNPLTLLSSKPVRLLPITPATNPASQRNTIRPTEDPPTTSAPNQSPGEAGGTAALDRPSGEAGDTAAALDQPSGQGGGMAAGLVVAAAGVLTVGGGLMIRRH
jgi:murein DD-endopeptidase MepM/ murein hydrolase activator NlpD